MSPRRPGTRGPPARSPHPLNPFPTPEPVPHPLNPFLAPEPFLTP